MKQGLLKYLKMFLIVLAAILIVLLIFGLVLSLDWPWWMGFFLLLILVGLGIGFLFLRKLWLRRREENFVQQVIEQDESQLKSLAGKEKDDLKELQNRWKEAIEALRTSHLKKYGNPLYVLPWYMVIGESGSGKTTSISSARLSSPFAEVRRTSGISGTRNCDWWFFEQAIIIDTAGRYAIPIDEEKDKEEWQRFLSLLLKYRKKEPLHGLIVTVAADKLLGSGAEALEEDGRNIRRRIDELMRVLGAKFPVYVLVTKCDLIQGMSQFCEQVSEKSLNQAMGVINQDLSTDVAAFEDHAMNSLGERLRNLRILLLHSPERKRVDPTLLLFPEEFENLKTGLEGFMKGAFRENPYQETPILRGIFFSSGRQEGSPYSHFLNALGLIGEKETLPGTNKGLFLHEFFSKILPADRGLLTPTKRVLEWHRITRNLGLTAWIVLVIALCGLLSFSFVKNLRAIREASHEFAKPVSLRGDVLADLGTMDRFAQAILNVEAKNRNWWVPRLGLHESVDVETGLKERYCNQFQNGFLMTFDRQMAATLARVTSSAPDEVIGQYILHLVRRINLLKARIEGQSLEALRKKPQPSYEPAMFSGGQPIIPELRGKFGSLYLYYLLWRSNLGDVNKEIATLQAWLRQVLAAKGGNLRWTVVWVNRYGGLSPVSLAEFWGGGSPATGEKTIEPAFTLKGKDQIDSFQKEIESALPDPVFFANSRSEFDKWYRSTCLESWYAFAGVFPRGMDRLKSLKQWQHIAAGMAGEEGPYFAFLNRSALELAPFAKAENPPSWIQALYQFEIVKTASLSSEKGLLTKAAEQGKKLVTSVEKSIGKDIGGEVLETQLQLAKAYQDYRSSLQGMTPVSASRNQAFQLVSQVFSEDPATSKSPFLTSMAAAGQMRSLLFKGKVADEIFWKLMTGPVEFMWTFARMEAACHLQNQWEQGVLSELEGATGPQLSQLLSIPEGPVWKFVKGPVLSPFITWSVQRGYFAREALGGAMPFDSAFFPFLRQSAAGRLAAAAPAGGVAKPNYKVTIHGLPTDANPDALKQPKRTRLEMQCGETTLSLINDNYPVSGTFNWTPETCGDVVFQIYVGDLILTKKYTGNYGFAAFLKDFRGGQRTFYPQDFPADKSGMAALRVKHIRVNYQFTGDHQAAIAAIGQMHSAPTQAPRRIVRCWEQ